MRHRDATPARRGVVDGRIDAESYYGLTDDELRRLPRELVFQLLNQELNGSGQLSLEQEVNRERWLGTPSLFLTECIDDFYAQFFDRAQYQMIDEVLGPWCLGQDARWEGVTYDPHDYVGLMVLFARGTYKSSILKWMVLWYACYLKVRKNKDARTAYIHKVLDKAVGNMSSLKEVCRQHAKFRAHYPEFAVPPNKKQWDSALEFRFPCYKSFTANEWSVRCYGETSSKTGGHYTLRVTDDWVDADSATTDRQLQLSEEGFNRIDNLKDRTEKYKPWIGAGTIYHWGDLYMRKKRGSGWLVLEVPAHKGSPKVIFDLAENCDPRIPAEKRQIERTLATLEKERADDLNFPKIYPWRELYMSASGQRAESESGLGADHTEYNTQLLLNPNPEGEQQFPHDAIDRMWTREAPEPGMAQGICRIDPGTTGATGFVINICLVRWDGHRFFVDGFCGREKRSSAQLRRAFTLVDKWMAIGYKFQSIGIESVAYQETLAANAREGIAERTGEEGEMVPFRKAPCMVLSIKRSPEMRKDQRIARLENPVNRGELHVWTENPIAKKLTEHMKWFPHGPKDILDTMHDCWVKVRGFGQPMAPEGRKIHPIFQELMKSAMLGEKKNSIRGLSNRTRLQSQGR